MLVLRLSAVHSVLTSVCRTALATWLQAGNKNSHCRINVGRVEMMIPSLSPVSFCLQCFLEFRKEKLHIFFGSERPH
jgi:hypothetical protein